jgi:hypothetical protein
MTTRPLALAKRRAARRRSEAGAAMFIVSMTIAVLASVGVYALAAAANEVKTSGNERQGTQTHYLSEYGIIGTTHAVYATQAQYVLGLTMNAKSMDTSCVSLPGVTSGLDPMTTACRRLGASELTTISPSAWATTPTVSYSGGSIPLSKTATPGSLGPTPMLADFFVELTTPTQGHRVPRYGDAYCFIQLTVTSSGITQPIVAGTGGVTAQFGSEGLEVARARILAGPIKCPR